MNGMITILIWASVAVGISFVCSLIEAVMLSITDAQIAAISETKPGLGYKWEKYNEDISTPLFGVLALNTISHTAGAGGVGAATLQTYGDEAVAVAAVILTLMILIFSELIPKTIGEKYAKQLAGPVGHAIFVINIITYPLVKPINLVRHLFPDDESISVERSDVKGLIGIAGDSGVIQSETETTLNNVMRFSEMKISEIMTPIEIVETITFEKACTSKLPCGHEFSYSKIPLSDRKNFYVRKAELSQSPKNATLCATICVNGDLPAMDLNKHLKLNNLVFVTNEEDRRIGIVCREDVLDFLLATPTKG